MSGYESNGSSGSSDGHQQQQQQHQHNYHHRWCSGCRGDINIGGNNSNNNSGGGGSSSCHGCQPQKIDNSVKVLEKIAGLYAERLLSDIVLEVNGRPYASHRLILCASSDVFQVMLMNPNWTESQERTIVLQEAADCARVFPEFLKYLYTGIININHSLVLPLVSLADKYNVRDLVALCVDYMRNHMVAATKHNRVVSWLQHILGSDGHDQCVRACVNFVTANFEQVAKTSDFQTMETDVLILFLRKSDLVVTDEYRLLQIVTEWLESQEDKLRLVGDEFFDSMVPIVMSFIRFPMMEPRQLAELLINPLMIRYKEFFVHNMSLAMKYHHEGLTGELLGQLPANSFTPRLYTTEKWSSSLVIDNYRNLPVYGVRTLVFTTPSALSEVDARRSAQTATYHTSTFNDQCCPYEWAIEIYPKGVWFKKFLLIHYSGCLEIPESVSKTVRLTVRQSDRLSSRRVSIGVLLYGRVDGIEYIHRVIQKTHIFTDKHRLVNIDDIVDFGQLNEQFVSSSSANGSPMPDTGAGGCFQDTGNSSNSYSFGSNTT
ncbi:BTB/POZ domain-containing protein 17-like, partial [Oppia nitens]|uniref:BTB/POZ domain-containing protein 17-like n=1 Tax=Oppia nitens TaxID=1686743 RepID=UPI0023DB2496